MSGSGRDEDGDDGDEVGVEVDEKGDDGGEVGWCWRVTTTLGVLAALLVGCVLVAYGILAAAVPWEADVLDPSRHCYADPAADPPDNEVGVPGRENGTWLHCEACGACSTRTDIAVMAASDTTLTNTVKACAASGVWDDFATLSACLEPIGFTPACQACWEDNVKCDAEQCAFLCLVEEVFPRDVFTPGALSPCLKCDEARCGPAFKQCAGANRRRIGVHTDIQRADSEMCQGRPASVRATKS